MYSGARKQTMTNRSSATEREIAQCISICLARYAIACRSARQSRGWISQQEAKLSLG